MKVVNNPIEDFLLHVNCDDTLRHRGLDLTHALTGSDVLIRIRRSVPGMAAGCQRLRREVT